MKYIKRTTEGTMVLDKKAQYFTSGIKQFINQLCIKNLSTFEGREYAARRLLKISSNLPIYIDDTILLFPSKSIRNYDCIYLNFHKILTVKKRDDGLSKVIFDDLSELDIDVSHIKLHRQFTRANIIFEYKNSY